MAAFKGDETVVELSRQSEVHPNRTTSRRVSNAMDVSFCVEALEEALGRYGRPGIFDTGQGSRFTSEAFTEVLKERGIGVSMDGKGSWRDNVFVKRLCVVLSPRETGILSRCEFPDAEGKRVARDADGNVAFRWKTESQFRARLQRWIFE